MSKINRLVPLLIVILASGCSGGGGSGGGGSGEGSGGDGGGSGGGSGSGSGGGGTGTFFNVARGFNGPVNTVVGVPDGSTDVYVGGQFSVWNDTAANGLVRLNVDGTVDNAFNTGTGFNGPVAAIVVVPDGSGDIYVSGDFTGYDGSNIRQVARLNSDGSLDTGFGTGLGFNGGVHGIAPVADGSDAVYVGGVFDEYNGDPAPGGLVRLNGNGSRDNTFRLDAESTGAIGTGTSGLLLANDGSGDLYVIPAAHFTRLVRINGDGSRDTAFDIGTGFDDRVESVALSEDGSDTLYVGGRFSNYDGVSVTSVVRLANDGTLDSNFVTGSGLNGAVNSVAVSADGGVFAGGSFTVYRGNPIGGLVKIASDGSFDHSYEPGEAFDGGVQDIFPVAGSGGALFVAGDFQAYRGSGVTELALIETDATLNTAFNSGAGFDGEVFALAVAADGSGDVYAGGFFSKYNGRTSVGLARLNSDGSYDAGFDVGTGFDRGVTNIITADDGSGDIYVSGTFQSYDGVANPGLIRINADGSLDTGFDASAGTSLIQIIFRNSLALAVDGSGDLFAQGAIRVPFMMSDVRVDVIRLDDTGAVVESFDTLGADPASGFGRFGNGPLKNGLFPAMDGSGDVYVAGNNTMEYDGLIRGPVLRLNADGSPDDNFDVSGLDSGKAVSGMAADDGSGDIYAAGTFDLISPADRSVLRFNESGLIDPDFDGASVSGSYSSLARSDDGSGDIYAGGTSGLARFVVADSGAVDPAFTAAFDRRGRNNNPSVKSVISAGDGDGTVYAAGAFGTYNGTVVGNIVRVDVQGNIN